MTNRSRNLVVLLVSLVIFFAFAAPLGVIIYVEREADETQLAVVCTSARANISQLEALADISRTLGIPFHFTIPPLPPECA